MGKFFGTDGVRGLANGELTPELAMRLSLAAVPVLARGVRRPVVVVGRDTRVSGHMLEAAVCAGLTSAGADVVRLGVIPTPAVAYFTSAYPADFGVVLSASHNPMPDNGIKFFSRGGGKLSDSDESAIEDGMLAASPSSRPVGADIGRIDNLPSAQERYISHLLATVDHRLDGLRIVVDCAHGAASECAPALYARAGAEVLAIGAEPNGVNINDGVGSTSLEPLIAAVREHNADLGLAHDGDADRCLAVDSAGAIVDGDQILGVLADGMHEAGALPGSAVVATVMSNVGFHHAMRARGISVVTCPVGDRYVLTELTERGLMLGGEQSGHIVMRQFATTGDGLLTGVQLASRVAGAGRPLADLAATVKRFPQVLRNVSVSDKEVATSPEVRAAIAEAQEKLGEDGRILLRPSGTEPLIRVMVEASTEGDAERVAEQLAHVVARQLPLRSHT